MDILLGLHLGPIIAQEESCFPREIKSRPRGKHVCKKTNKSRTAQTATPTDKLLFSDNTPDDLQRRHNPQRKQSNRLQWDFQKLLDAARPLPLLPLHGRGHPLFDAQSYYPDVLADLNASYDLDHGEFLVVGRLHFFVGTAAILSELFGSPKASYKLKMVYFPFLGVAFSAVIRGLLPYRGKTSAAGSMGPSFVMKKRP